jgi:hypothetical protein
MHAVQGGILGGHKSAPVSHKHKLSQPSFSSPLVNEDLPAGPQLVFTFNNRFFRHQACYSLLPGKPGGQADRVISLCKYKVVGRTSPPEPEFVNVEGAQESILRLHRLAESIPGLRKSLKLPSLKKETERDRLLVGEGGGAGSLWWCTADAQINFDDITPYIYPDLPHASNLNPLTHREKKDKEIKCELCSQL